MPLPASLNIETTSSYLSFARCLSFPVGIPYITVVRLISTGLAIILAGTYKKRTGIDSSTFGIYFIHIHFSIGPVYTPYYYSHSLAHLVPVSAYVPLFTYLQLFNTLSDSEYISNPIRFTLAVDPCFLLKLSLTELELYSHALAKSCPTMLQRNLPWMDSGRFSPSRLHPQ